MLTELNVSTLRNIKAITIQPVSGVNLFVGSNGSGKTTLLEAIHLLAMGKSFRSRQLKTLIQFEHDSFRVTGRMQQHNIPVGLNFHNKEGLVIRFNNAPLKKLSDLAKQIPLQNIPANSHQFFELGPQFRRQLLDWGLFHVEQGFNYHWLSYKKALQQRNAALKAKRSDQEIKLWDESLAVHGGNIDQFRQKHLSAIREKLITTFQQICPEFTNVDIDLKYSTGWPADRTLAQSLDEGVIRDKQLSYTRNGPHRADWSVIIHDSDASHILSRGQQKLFFLALCLVQLKCNQDRKIGNSILLIDDLRSELDDKHIALVIEQLSKLSVQSFITATDNVIEDLLNKASINNKVFHVEQGNVS